MPDLPPDCVPRIRGGDVGAFEALYRAMHTPLVLFAERYTGDPARAEELVQDLFFDVWRTRESWVITGSVSAYLYQAVRNRALNLRRRDAVEADWVEDESREEVRALHAAPVVADTQLEHAEAVQRLRVALAHLPGQCALVMQMRWQGGLSYADIADTLGISIKGVENQLARGLKALRAAMGTD